MSSLPVSPVARIKIFFREVGNLNNKKDISNEAADYLARRRLDFEPEGSETNCTYFYILTYRSSMRTCS